MVSLRTKTNDMSTIKIPQNGLPQEISSIPFGQVFVLTDPEQGITSTTTNQILAIISIAGKLGQSHIVYALPVQYSGLWGCNIYVRSRQMKGVRFWYQTRTLSLKCCVSSGGLTIKKSARALTFHRDMRGM